MIIKGVARTDRRTKDLVKRLRPNEIAVIDHEDIDEVSAEALLAARVKAVVNARKSMSGRYPNLGPGKLCDAGVYILDDVGDIVMTSIKEGDEVEIVKNLILKGGKVIGVGKVLGKDAIEKKLEETKQNITTELENFVQNTLEYASKETSLILGDLAIPETRTNFKEKHVLVVVRGPDYKDDLSAIQSYIEEVSPVIIGVDGGADALREMGYNPDVIIGDMDSISDETLRCGAEIIVHAYPDGKAPGLKRVEELGLDGSIFPAPGTSEDLALLLAYEKGADLIVAVGTHSNMIDFLEKGRKGMASTFLVRLKVGSILVDAKGVNKLYRGRMRLRYLLQVSFAALIPVVIVVAVSDPIRQLLRLIFMQFKVMLGIM